MRTRAEAAGGSNLALGRLRHCRSHLLALGLVLIGLLLGADRIARDVLADARFRLLTRPATGDIVLVAIDSVSIDRIGVWPWPRTVHAELIEALTRAGASEIAFDVDFSSSSAPEADQAFEDALAAAGGSVILPSFQQLVRTDRDKLYVDRPLERFAKVSWPASVNVEPDRDGVVRRYRSGITLDGEFVPALAALLAGRLDPGAGSFAIDYGVLPRTLPTVSVGSVLDGDPRLADAVGNKKVLVGATAVELGDRFQVPNGQVISGVLLQALAAESILQDRALRSTSPLVGIAGLAAIVAVMGWTWRRVSARGRTLLLVTAAVLWEVVALLVQRTFPIAIDTSLVHIATLAYLVAIALHELNLRALLQRIADGRFRQVAMALTDGLVFFDSEGTITFWNPGAERIFAIGPQEAIGTPFESVVSAADRPQLRFLVSRLSGPSDQGPVNTVLELEGRRADGTVFPLEVCVSSWTEKDGAQFGAILRDVSERKRKAEQILYLARNDTLTGLPNRNAVYDMLDRAMEERDSQGREIAVLMLDLDRFKDINDTLGHRYGDEMLFMVAARLRELVGADGLVGRMGGDEFTIVLTGADAASRAADLSERVLDSFRTRAFRLAGEETRVGTSIGVSQFPRDCSERQELLANADIAMYRAKASGHNRCVFFERTFKQDLERRLSLAADLEEALAKDQFELFYQPQVRLSDGLVVGAEALIRWRHPVRGLVSPAEFMPVVDTNAISDKVSTWVLATACRQGRAWQDRGADLTIGVNLSPSQFKTGNLVSAVTAILAETGLCPDRLELEVTENILLEDDEHTLHTFEALRSLGVRIALDDFGTGYASLTYLKRFPIDRLKIDQLFVRSIVPGSTDAGIVDYTIRLSKLLNLSVIAEGIEDQGTAELLRAMGCDEGQGYHFGRPMPTSDFAAAVLPFCRSGPADIGLVDSVHAA